MTTEQESPVAILGRNAGCRLDQMPLEEIEWQCKELNSRILRPDTDPHAEGFVGKCIAARRDVRRELLTRYQAGIAETESALEPLPRDAALCPFGKRKGEPLTALSNQDLSWLASRLRSDMADPVNAKWRDKNGRDLLAIDRELRARFQ
jgi:hypothetical protein